MSYIKKTNVTLYGRSLTPTSKCIIERRDIVIEDIEDYLANNYSASTHNNVTWKENGLKATAKLYYSNEGVDYIAYDNRAPYYLKAETALFNSETDFIYKTYGTAYYHIDSTKKLSDNAIELELTLDVLNTHYEWYKTKFDKLTFIKRQHQDRFYHEDDLEAVYFTRKIDEENEGINPQLYNIRGQESLTNMKDLLNPNKIYPANKDFYLAYRTLNDNKEDLQYNPLQVELYASDTLRVGDTLINTLNIKGIELFDESYSYYINNTAGLTMNYKEWAGGMTSINLYAYESVMFIKIVGVHKWRLWAKKSDNTVLNVDIDTNAVYQFINHTNNTTLYKSTYPYTISDSYNEAYAKITSQLVSHAPLGIGIYPSVPNINELDRTDARLIKVIKLPYPPLEFNKLSSATKYSYDTSKWEFVGNIFRLKDLTTQFKYDALITPNTNMKDIIRPYINYFGRDIARDDFLESKLYSSEFFNYKLIYDSFATIIPLEDVDVSTPALINQLSDINITYLVTSTINSKFMFRINTKLTKYTEDYKNLIVITRNNEITLYNNSYINYMKTGYTFDKKAQEQNNVSNWVNTAISLGGSAVSLATGNVLSVGMVTSAIGNVKNSITAGIQSQRAIENKIAQLKMQSASVLGSDDVDLMSEYCSNKLNLVISEPRPKVKQDLADLFYYHGYAVNKTGVPELNTRRKFNYVECEPVFTDLYMRDDILSEIKNRFSKGVTIFHNNATGSVATWDTAQVKENWERNV